MIHRQEFMDGPIVDGYDVVVCSRCGAGFADGIPPQEVIDRYYADQSKYTYDHTGGAESPWDFSRFEDTARQVEPHLNSRTVRILDIGCATGGLLSLFKKRGFSNLTGVDPSPACAAAASRLYGIEVRIGTVSQLNDWNDSFDLILMLGVLEHLREAGQGVRAASRLLSRGGLLYCAVPDVEGLADCPNAPYQQFSVEHLNFFSTRSLNNLMANGGMGAVRTWRWTVEWRQGIYEPIASGLYRRMPTEAIGFDESTGKSLDRYLASSRKDERRIVSIIDSLQRSGEAILVWGAGTLARRLLATTNFANSNIIAFVDSNPHLRGLSLANRPILEPHQIVDRKETILICSWAFEMEIIETIRKRLGLQNQIISLHQEESS